jgi:hypothetical protein
MALEKVLVPQKKQVLQEGDSGGGVFGSIAGAILGAAAVIASGGTATPAVAAVAAGAATGASLGGLAGGVVAPATKDKYVDANTLPQFSEAGDEYQAMKKRAQESDPASKEVKGPEENQVGPEKNDEYKAHLEKALVAIDGLDDGDVFKQKAGPVILKAYSKLGKGVA